MNLLITILMVLEFVAIGGYFGYRFHRNRRLASLAICVMALFPILCVLHNAIEYIELVFVGAGMFVIFTIWHTEVTVRKMYKDKKQPLDQ